MGRPSSPSARVARRARATATRLPESLRGLLRRPRDHRGGRRGSAARPRRPREPCPRSRLVGVGARPEARERRAAQIGDHVSDQYRLPSGKALVAVTYAGPPTVTGPDGSTLPGARYRRAAGHDRRASGGRRHRHGQRRRTPSCTRSAASGQRARSPKGRRAPRAGSSSGARRSSSRSTRSSTSTESTRRSCCCPPRADGKAATAVFLERGDVRAELDRPLDQTLTAPLTPGVGEIQLDEQRVVDRTTRSRLYEYSYLQAQDGSPVMVLAPALSGLTVARGVRSRACLAARSSHAREGPPRHARLLPRAGAHRSRPHPRRALVLPHPRLPPLPRLRVLADDPADERRRVGRSRHARALPHLAGPASRAAHVAGST